MTAHTMEMADARIAAANNGHWRNKFWSGDGWTDCDPEALKVDANTCIMSDRYASEADAERDGRKMVEDASHPDNRWYDPVSVIVYLGPVFFSNEGEQS